MNFVRISKVDGILYFLYLEWMFKANEADTHQSHQESCGMT